MKKFTISLFMLISTVAFAQKPQQLHSLSWRMYFEKTMKLGENESLKFWEYFNQYDKETILLDSVYGTYQITLITNYQNLKVDEIEDMVDKLGDIDTKIIKFRERAFNKIRKNCSTSTALRFYQIDAYVRHNIKLNRASQLPFYND